MDTDATNPRTEENADLSLWNGGPGNERDRKRFAALDSNHRADANAMARELYGDGLTVARCWSLAIDTATRHEGEENADSISLTPLVLLPGVTNHDEYGNCLPDVCDCDYARECRAGDVIPVCRNCHRAIWRHVYGGEVIWRHFTGLMLCQPDEDAPDFTGVEGAEPMDENDGSIPGQGC